MLGYMAIKSVYNAQLRVYYHTFLSKWFIIRRFEANYSTFLLNTFIIRGLWVDYSTFLYEGFFD